VRSVHVPADLAHFFFPGIDTYPFRFDIAFKCARAIHASLYMLLPCLIAQTNLIHIILSISLIIHTVLFVHSTFLFSLDRKAVSNRSHLAITSILPLLPLRFSFILPFESILFPFFHPGLHWLPLWTIGTPKNLVAFSYPYLIYHRFHNLLDRHSCFVKF
jgi:hypothetical protein